jgi:hypothetical protein
MRWWNWITYYCEPREECVRVFVNDARQRLEFCDAGEDGMCKLDEFLKSQRYARNDGVRISKGSITPDGEQAPTPDWVLGLYEFSWRSWSSACSAFDAGI